MKRMTAAAVLCTALFAIACTKEKVRPDDPDGPQGLSELVVEGPWKVALFIDDGDDDTDYFDGYLARRLGQDRRQRTRPIATWARTCRSTPACRPQRLR